MRCRLIVLALLTAIPTWADSHFRINIIPRPELPPGKGQCDIRLEIDNQVQVTIRGDQILAKTISGAEARDGGSDCNEPLPDREMQSFSVQPVEGRGDFHILERPSARNHSAVVLRIGDPAAGLGRYHFRLSWEDSPNLIAADGSKLDRKSKDNEHPNAPPGFVWNNAINYRGRGGGESILNERSTQRLGDVRVDIDLGGKVLVSFTPEQPRGSRPLVFSGIVIARESSTIRASMMTEDQRLHGTMTISIDEAKNVKSISMNATDGQDQLHLTWDRR